MYASDYVRPEEYRPNYKYSDVPSETIHLIWRENFHNRELSDTPIAGQKKKKVVTDIGLMCW